MLYNKFPFADYHALLVIEPEQQLPQLLTRDVHDLVMMACEQFAAGMPQIGIGYNAFGAAASVNHLHLQLYARSSAQYPIESSQWQHNGGEQRYPLDCRRFHDHDEAWHYIAHLHAANKAYNLIYRPDSVYVIIRKMQGHFTCSEKLAGIGWSDVAGSVTVFTQDDFEHVDTAFLLSEYRKVALYDD